MFAELMYHNLMCSWALVLPKGALKGQTGVWRPELTLFLLWHPFFPFLDLIPYHLMPGNFGKRRGPSTIRAKLAMTSLIM